MYPMELLPPRRSKQAGAKKISNLYGINSTTTTTTTASTTATITPTTTVAATAKRTKVEAVQTKQRVRNNIKQPEREDKDWKPSYYTSESEEEEEDINSSSSGTDVSSEEESTTNDEREEMELPVSPSRQQMSAWDSHGSNSPDSHMKREIIKREKTFSVPRHEPRHTKLIDDTSIEIKKK